MTETLREKLDNWDGYPPAWKPQEGEILVGTILQYDTGESTFGPVHTCIIETEEGERLSLWLSSTVLLSQFRRYRPKIGERIGIKYQGKDQAKGYHRYRLVVDRPGEEVPDFDALGGEEERTDGDPDWLK
jgi:hypothetical protein